VAVGLRVVGAADGVSVGLAVVVAAADGGAEGTAVGLAVVAAAAEGGAEGAVVEGVADGVVVGLAVVAAADGGAEGVADGVVVGLAVVAAADGGAEEVAAEGFDVTTAAADGVADGAAEGFDVTTAAADGVADGAAEGLDVVAAVGGGGGGGLVCSSRSLASSTPRRRRPCWAAWPGGAAPRRAANAAESAEPSAFMKGQPARAVHARVATRARNTVNLADIWSGVGGPGGSAVSASSRKRAHRRRCWHTFQWLEILINCERPHGAPAGAPLRKVKQPRSKQASARNRRRPGKNAPMWEDGLGHQSARTKQMTERRPDQMKSKEGEG